jgi:hypothetical protein
MMQPLAWYRRNWGGYNDYYVLLADYFEHRTKQSSKDKNKRQLLEINGFLIFCTFEGSPRTIAISLINVWGFLSSQFFEKITKNSSSCFEEYKKRLNHAILDQSVTLRNSYVALKSNQQLNIQHGILQQYSWKDTPHLNSITPQEKIKQDFIVCFLLSPMPCQLMRILELEENTSLRGHIEKYSRDRLSVIQDLYNCLTAKKTSPSVRTIFPDISKASFKKEEFLLKHAASTTASNFISYSEELTLYGKQTKQEDKIKKVLSELNLTHFVSDDFEERFYHVKIDTSYTIGKWVAESKSFQEYMIHKTIYLIEEVCPLSQQTIVVLEALFQNENKRVDFIFFIRLLYSLYCSDEQETKPTLKQYVNWISPFGKDRREIFERADLLTGRLFRNEQDDLRIARGILYVFHINHMNDFALKENEKIQLFESIYQLTEERFAELKLVIGCYETILFEKSSMSTSLALTSEQEFLNAAHLLNSFKYEILLKFILPADFLSNTCLHLLLEEIFKKSINIQNQVFSCIYHWIGNFVTPISFKNDQLQNLIEGLSTSVLQEEDEIEDTGQKETDSTEEEIETTEETELIPNERGEFYSEPLESSDEESLHEEPALSFMQENDQKNSLLAIASRVFYYNHSISKDIPLYDLMQSILYLLNFNKTLMLNSQQFDFLFKRIRLSNFQDCERCAIEFVEFSSSFKQKESDISELRLNMLNAAYREKQNKVSEIPGEKIADLLENWPASVSSLVDFQINFIHQVENFLQEPMPLMAVLFLLLYCPFIPFDQSNPDDDFLPIGKAMEKLQDIKIHLNFSEVKSLFILPQLIKTIDVLITNFMNSDIRMNAGNYAQKGMSLDFVTARESFIMGGISRNLQTLLLPSFSSFRDTICTQAKELFDSQGNALSEFHQNEMIMPLEIQGSCYIGEWKEVCYMCQWGIQEVQSQYFPYLEITLWKSIDKVESRRICALLEIETKDLNKDLWRLLSKMIETLGEEIGLVDREEQIQKLSNLEEELLFCVDVYGDQLNVLSQLNVGNQLDVEYHLGQDKGKDQEVENLGNDYLNLLKEESVKGLALLDFVKNLKVKVRQAHSSFREPLEDKNERPSNSEIAAFGNVYCKEDRLSLLPDDVEDLDYQILHKDLTDEFSTLIQFLRSSNSEQDFHYFCSLNFGEDQMNVEVSFDPLEIKIESEDISVDVPQVHFKKLNRVTLKLVSPQPITSAQHITSVSWGPLIHHMNLERFLRWQLLMLKNLYAREF